MSNLQKSKKLTVALLFGGQSAEHEVSVQSARNVFAALDAEKYNVVLVYIKKDGRWFQCAPEQLTMGDVQALERESSKEVALLPGSGGAFIFAKNGKEWMKADVVFPVLHGPHGEDGTVQGLLELAGVPYVGAGVVGAAVGMDKDIMKRLLAGAGLPVGKFLVYRAHEASQISFDQIEKNLGMPVFVKPANLGSSVGVSKVKTEEDLQQAVREAFEYDRKIIIETALVGREVECAVLGTDKSQASGVGEIIPTHEFYSYEAKYIDTSGAQLVIPADLPRDTTEEIQRLAVETFQVLECRGLGRVDFFVTAGGIFVNEINTLPGFTSISMYPKLWEAAGVEYKELIDRLIVMAMDDN